MCTVPSEAPTDLKATASTFTTIVVAWKLPPVDARNGIIKGFKLFYKQKGSVEDSPPFFHIKSVSILNKTVAGLREFTDYEFQVLAFTSVGDGPKSPVLVVRTKRRKGDGERNCYLYLFGL